MRKNKGYDAGAWGIKPQRRSTPKKKRKRLTPRKRAKVEKKAKKAVENALAATVSPATRHILGLSPSTQSFLKKWKETAPEKKPESPKFVIEDPFGVTKGPTFVDYSSMPIKTVARNLAIKRAMAQERSMRTVQMDKLPKCDICKRATAKYDAQTKMGPHAYMCQACFDRYGTPIGTKLEKRVKIAAAKTSKVPSVMVPLTVSSVATVRCPHCGEPRSVEPDANYTVTCESCGNEYRVYSAI